MPVAVWLSLLVAARWLIPCARRGGLTRGQAAVAVAVAAVSAVGWDRRPHSPAGALDWSIFGAVWLLAFVALSRPAWEWVPGALLVLAVNGFFVLRLLGTAALCISRLAAATYVVVVILSVFATLRPTLRVLAGLAARRAELAGHSAAERAAIAAIHEDRRDRLALLELEALPLLRGIADGSLDPAGEDVRQECARHATTLRRALADRARRRGLQIEIRVVGDPGLPSCEVAQATLGAVDTVLRALPAQTVTLTVLTQDVLTQDVLTQDALAGPPPGVGLYLTFGRLPPEARAPVFALALAPPAGLPGWRAALDVDAAGSGCLEVSWRAAVPG